MERLYCTINEEQARIAHDMMSMSDYKVGSKTEEYRGYHFSLWQYCALLQ